MNAAAAVHHFANFTPEFTLTAAGQDFGGGSPSLIGSTARGRAGAAFRAEGKFGILSSYLT